VRMSLFPAGLFVLLAMARTALAQGYPAEMVITLPKLKCGAGRPRTTMRPANLKSEITSLSW